MQKNKIIIVSAVVIVITLAILTAAYMLEQNKIINFDKNTITGEMEAQNNQNDGATGGDLQNKTAVENQTETSNAVEKNKLVTESFSMDLPVGWKGVPNTLAEVAAMAANINENIDDAAAKAINFKSYLAVSSDLLEGKNIQEYMASVKNELQAAVPGVTFLNENNLTINGKTARAIEVEMTQQGVNFKVLIVAIHGNNNDVWVLSYNTVKNSWDGYAEGFAESARSFILKK